MLTRLPQRNFHSFFSKMPSKVAQTYNKFCTRWLSIFGRYRLKENNMFKRMHRNYFGKNSFNSRLDNMINELVSKLPNQNVGLLLVGINTFFYLLYLARPRDTMHKFLNNFTISQYNLSRGRFHTLILGHFTHMGFLSYAIDSLILYLFCQNLMFMFGPVYIVKL